MFYFKQNYFIFFNLKIEIRNECYCGDKYGLFGNASLFNLSCNKKCSNNSLQVCGGGSANSIWFLQLSSK